MTLEEFVQKLGEHDWFFERADSFKRWSKGKKQREELLAFAKQDQRFQELFNEMLERMNFVTR